MSKTLTNVNLLINSSIHICPRIHYAMCKSLCRRMCKEISIEKNIQF